MGISYLIKLFLGRFLPSDLTVLSRFILSQGFSLALALRHSPKIFPDVREFAAQFGQFVRDDFWKRTLYGNAQ